MRIDLASIDREQFSLKEDVFCGVPAILVTPALQGTQWTQANKHLRSSIWSLDGELLSAGLPKFTNAGENPEHFPMPTSLDNAVMVEKIDGSLAVFDYANGQFSCRSRGTFSYVTLDNATDWTHCIAKYPLIQSWCCCHPDHSLLCEITSPNQRIIIDYGEEPDLTLIGVVNKTDYSLWSQKRLDIVATDLNLRRPRYFSFSSLDHLLSDVKTWEGLEGCVIYSGNDQVLHKAKADSYLRKHRFKERATLPNTLDIWMAQGKPNLPIFKEALLRDFDHECYSMVETYAMEITSAAEQVNGRLQSTRDFVEPFRSVARRDAAITIQERIRAPYQGPAFTYLSGREIDDKQYRKLIEFSLDI